ncbi:MAG: hypothetical protein ABL898_02110 [Hyphomicrobiaceae bacterium]
MPIAVTASQAIVLGTPNANQSSAFRWLSPILIGLSLPTLFTLVFLQDSIAQIRTLILLIMIIALAISIFAYVMTVLLPGDPTSLNVIVSKRHIEVVLVGPFAATKRLISFEDVATLRTTVRYDDDGYSENVAELTTLDGEVFTLAMSQSSVEFQAARQAMGLVSRR